MPFIVGLLEMTRGHWGWPNSYVVCSNRVSILHLFGDINTCLSHVINFDLEQSFTSIMTLKL